MRLKALEMQGFKSFPDKTTLNFNQGITVIVGPNGSGKSNITDAVRWVLGEMSTKSIRSSKMEDVIFGGSDNRRPMGYAEVSLIIDNTVGIGRLDSEYDEVTVTRRYYRGGDSEYLINGKTVRLKDIAELFMNTGVGKTGYSNIGQGKIAEIISQKSDERRSVFEEAAGISKYRYKKNEAERKLKDTEDNLVRLTDILSELASRVGPLEKEANAARRYLDYFEQKKAVDVSLWLFDAEAMRAKANETERAYMAAKLELESADAEIASLEQKSELLYQKAADGQIHAEELNRQISEIVGRRHDMESSSRVLQNDILHIGEHLRQTKDETERYRLTLSDGKGQFAVQKETLNEHLRKQAETAADLSSLLSSIAQQKSVCEEAERVILEKEDEERQIEAGLVNMRVKLSALEGSHQAEDGRSQSLQEEIAEGEAHIAELSDAMKRVEKTVGEYKEAVDRENQSLTEVESLIASGEQARDSAKAAVDKIHVLLETKSHRAETLRRMDDLLEGYSYSVKNVMHAAKAGTLYGICGPVSQVISVLPQNSIAIETALGANIQNIITENEENAKAAIGFLKRTNGGRATFYPITSVKATLPSVSQADLQRQKGYVGMGDALCSFDPKYRGVIGAMLGRTAVFDTMDHASDAARAFGYRLRMVTLDGQLINAGGSFTGGSVKSDSGILTRTAEIAALKDEMTKLEIDLRSADAALLEIGEKWQADKCSAEDIRGRIALINTLLQAEMTEYQVAKSRLENEKERVSLLVRDLKGIGAENARFDEEYSSLTAEIKEEEIKRTDAKAATQKAIEARNAADDLLYGQTERLNGLQIEKASVDKDIEVLTAAIGQSEQSLSVLKEQIERGEELITMLTEKLRAAEETVRNNELATTTLDDDLKDLEEKHNHLIRENLGYEKRQSQIREEQRDMTHKREVIFREYTRLEGKRENLTLEHDRLAAKIWEDYELTYSQAAELGYPPVTEETRSAFGAKQNELKNKIRALGSVNVNAIEEYADVKARYDFNKTQVEDLTKARESLDGIIDRLEREMKVRFTEAVEEINRHFKVTFRELFGGGTAEILLTDPENVLTSGIDINVAPPGKIIKNLISLSGGEQSFVAIALIFAILNVNPTPFCIFDEIESALDDVNVVRLSEYMRRYSEKTQFIAISHRRGTMEASDMLYGITMPDRGISKVLRMNVNEVEQKIGEKVE